MKLFYLLLLADALRSPSAGAQALRGGYVLANIPECADFFYFSNGRFLNYGGGDMGVYHGNGTFQVKGDSLVLRFDDWQAAAPVITIDSAFRADSTAGPTVRVLDAATSEPIFGVTIRSETALDFGAHTDDQGIARLPASLPPAGKFSICLIGYETKFIEEDFEKNRHLLVKLRTQSFYHHVAGGTRNSFLIKHPTSRFLLLKTKYETYRVATLRQTQYYLAEYKKLAK